jgi:RND family efflux transporter MFP subunit
VRVYPNPSRIEGCRPPRHTALVLLGALLAACGGNEYVEPPPPSVVVSQPEKRTVTDYLRATGRTEAVATVEIRARVEGFLESIEFEEGDTVADGDLLYQIDPSEYEAAVERAEAAVAVARASLQLATAKLTRLEKALETRAVSEIEVIEEQARRKEAKATVDARKADLVTARLDLGYTTIRAPMAGRIGRTLVDPGNLVGSTEDTLLTTLVQYDPIYANFDLSERQVLRITEETTERPSPADRIERIRKIPLELGLSNQEDYPFKGTIHYTDQGLDPGTGTYLIRGVFPNPFPFRLLPGLFVRVRTPIRERENALLVPERAIGSDQGGRYLYVVDADDVVQHRRVELGTAIDGARVIESGLKVDEWVIVEGVLRARPGSKVNPQRGGEPAKTAKAPGPGAAAEANTPRKGR